MNRVTDRGSSVGGPSVRDSGRHREGDAPSERSTPWRVEGARQQGGDGPDWSGFWRRAWWVLILAFGLNWLGASLLLAPAERAAVSYTFFREQVDAGNVSEVTSTGDTIEGLFERPVRYPPGGERSVEVRRFETQRPAFADDGLIDLLLARDVVVNAEPPERVPVWQQLLLGFGPTLLLIGLLVYLFRRGAQSFGGGLGPGGALGRSKARRYTAEAGPRVTFADVAGIDEVQAEVQEVVDFLRNPDRYRRLGATIPKGVLLSGPPGTGKTLLARAVAGEAGVPFFSVSAAEFIEMIVGVGASRVRDLFESASKEAPAIVFIDELDAIGRARGAGAGIGGHDEREQTLNQLLTEMDGFDGTEGVVVLAATNRPEILDPALLRPGRFDRRLTVNPPDQSGRRQILAVHTRSVPLAEDVDLDELASVTPGMVGADLKNLVNEAALLAGRRRHEHITRRDVLDALEKIVLGAERRITLSLEERERTSYHESGHALLGMLTPGADPVRKISIIPRGHALGVTLQTPETDRYGYVQRYLRGRIAGALGGRAAEELVYGDVSTGAENDLDHATRLARQMVGRWGMSERVGLASVLPAPGQEQLVHEGSLPAPATRELVDAEVRRILDECYAEALATLRANRDRLDRLARALLEHETLDADQAHAAAGLPRRAADAERSRPGPPAPAPAPPLPGSAPVAIVGADGGQTGNKT